jgi:hypothetical protein
MYNPIFEDDDKNGNLKQLRELIYIRSTKHNISELGSNILTFIKKHPVSFFTAVLFFFLGGYKKRRN